tara:strand:+ start:40 stop:312 length:273 start_codon:yes stop_codon:yes gene_type:complete
MAKKSYLEAWNWASDTKRKKLLKGVAETRLGNEASKMKTDYYATKDWKELPLHMRRGLSIEYLFGSGQSDVGNYDPLYDKRMKKGKKKNG